MKMILSLATMTLLLSCPVLAAITPESCLDIHRSVGVGMTRAMVDDFGLQEKDIQLNKTVMTLVSKNKVTEELAAFYAEQSYNTESTHFYSKEKGKAIYLESNASNIIVRFDYVNKDNKHNIMLSSHIVNEDECSVRFNGYIVEKREF